MGIRDSCDAMTSENFVDDDTGQDYRQALEEGYLPIREVARSTGINACLLYTSRCV